MYAGINKKLSRVLTITGIWLLAIAMLSLVVIKIKVLFNLFKY